MLKEKLLLGQYYAVESPVHRLTAQVKIIIAVIYMVALFITDDWWGWGFLAALCLVMIAVSRVPLLSIWRGMKLIAIFAAFTFVLNIFLYGGDTLLWSWRSLSVTAEGIVYGAAMGLRLLLLVAFASLLTLTTTPIELTDGIEALLKPLKLLGVPAHEIAMMMSIALRFIPTILEEFDRIILAQRARGADLAAGNLFKRARAMVPLLVPLFVASFRRADELAQAMEAKGYSGGEGRTRWHVAAWHSGDTLALLLFMLLFGAVIAYRVIC
ncbi:MAG: energy-coupling factor transporter transmembrane component T [Bacillota bacterium]|nr:energy-coupling factor transporter transmembrane component T [Bacillota bacterium]